MTDLTSLSAVQAAAAIGQGKITATELVTACLARIKERESDVKAWAHLDGDYALAMAKAADEAQRSGHGTGPLHGVPIGIKDIIDTADMPTQHGSPAFKDNQPTEDAAVITALKAAGAIIIGKTITTEMATLTPNVTRNPHNLAHTPGGSSSGSAAAVADNMVPAALGTQTGGSVIRPASFCGVYGFKPTFGMIPRPGVLNQSHTLDTVGIFGRSIEDLALLGDCLSHHDPRDPASLAHSRGSLLQAATAAWSLKPTFAFVKTSAWNDADPVLREAFGELAASLGIQVEEVVADATVERGLAAAKIIQNVEVAAHYGPVLDKYPDLISKRLAGQIEEGRKLTGAAYVAALESRVMVERGLAELFTNYNAVLTPAAPGPAPKGLESTGNPVFNAFWTYLGNPSVTLPLLATEDGLPIGVQIVGARRDDGRLLRTARLLERQLAEVA